MLSVPADQRPGAAPAFADPVTLTLPPGPARSLAAACSVSVIVSAAAAALALVGARAVPADYPDGLGRGGGTSRAFRPVPEPDRPSWDDRTRADDPDSQERDPWN